MILMIHLTPQGSRALKVTIIVAQNHAFDYGSTTPVKALAWYNGLNVGLGT